MYHRLQTPGKEKKKVAKFRFDEKAQEIYMGLV